MNHTEIPEVRVGVGEPRPHMLRRLTSAVQLDLPACRRLDMFTNIVLQMLLFVLFFYRSQYVSHAAV